jgi:tetratricopeptide (TPR) repeat protein
VARRLGLLWLLLAALALGAPEQAQHEEPPEEDEAFAPREYAFNPLQAEKELKVGNFYFKKGSYRAALARFEEAVKWDKNFSDAYLRIGETQEKLKDGKAALDAYQRFLSMEPESKRSKDVRARVSELAAKESSALRELK